MKRIELLDILNGKWSINFKGFEFFGIVITTRKNVENLEMTITL